MSAGQVQNTVDRVQSIFSELANREISTSAPLDELGLDSLVLIQGLVRVEEVFGVAMPGVDEILSEDGRTVAQLAELVDRERAP